MDFDIIVIGAGSGGTVLAEYGAKLGAKICLIDERERLGGDCLNYGCVPSKSYIHAAKAAYSAKNSSDVGVNNQTTIDYSQVLQSVYDAQDYIEEHHDNPKYFEDLSVHVVKGRASFTDKHTVSVGEQHYRAKKIVIATGSRPFIPPIEGIDDVEYLTNESFFEHKTLPQRLAVIGAGPVRLELGQAAAMLGSEVTFFESGERILARVDESIATHLQTSLDDLGATTVCNSKVTAVKKNASGYELNYTQNDTAGSLEVDDILVATGREANLDLNLDAAKVTYTERTIPTNKNFQTNQPHIYAIGDILDAPSFTHTAARAATVVLQHILFGISGNAGLSQTPWCIFTTPEIAHVGKTRQSLEEATTAFETLTIDYNEIDKAITDKEQGQINVRIDTKQRILGATIVGHNAGELCGLYSLAIANELKLSDMSKPIQAYPTYALPTQQLAAEYSTKHAYDGITGKLAMLLRKFRL